MKHGDGAINIALMLSFPKSINVGCPASNQDYYCLLILRIEFDFWEKIKKALQSVITFETNCLKAAMSVCASVCCVLKR